MRNIFLLLSLTLFSMLFSCQNKNKSVQSDYLAHIPEVNLNVTTSKRLGAEFYVMFDQEDSLAILSKNIDYVKFTTEDVPINIIFDPENRKDIYVLNSFNNSIKEINQVRYNFHKLNNEEYDSLFFEKRILTNPPKLKEPYIHMNIGSMHYTIYINSKQIKEGDIDGGW